MTKFYKNNLQPFLLGSVIFASACLDNKVEPPKADSFEVSDSLLHRVLIDTVQQADAKTELIFSAKITVNEERRSNLFPMVSGIVTKVNVRLGDEVRRGQTIAVIASSEIAGLDNDVTSAKAEFNMAQRSLTQAEQLFKSGLLSEKEVQEAMGHYQIKQAELKRANAVWKLNGGESKGVYSIKSPLNGFVIEKNATNNLHLREDNNESLFTIADLSEVWAMVNIYESDISQIKVGDSVRLSTLSYPEKIFKGKVDKIYNLIDQNSKVMNARVVIQNPNLELKPGMLGTAKILASSEVNLPVLNSRAVIFDNNKNYVLVLDSNNKIRIQEIKIGRKTAEKVYVSEGLYTGERVIASKQVFLFESLKSQ